MPTVNTEVYVGYIDVDVNLEDFDTEDLIEELQRRGQSIPDTLYVNSLMHQVYEKRRANQNFDYELSEIIYQSIGRFQ